MEDTLYVGRQDLPLLRYFSPAFWGRAIGSDIRELIRSRFILFNLVKTQLTTRYHRSSLGFLWTLLNPIMLLSVQAAVFSQVFGQNFASFTMYLFSGLVAWQFFAGGVDSGARSLISHEGILRKVRIPKFLCVLVEVISGAINLCFATAAILVLLLVISQILSFLGQLPAAAPTTLQTTPVIDPLSVHVQIVIFPIAALLMAIFVFGLALILMTILVWFRDTEHMIGIVLQAMYFTIPIVYKSSFVKTPELMSLLRLNPVLHHVALFQHALTLGTWPSVETWVWASASSVVALIVGYVTYKIFEDDYIYRL